ncbi:hypothetical protein QR680_010329 [Steinernema hermaphroditum]|uniref:Uncharacterized protein n=1 Tax=Steinernema hermaphroditum TaxID=289476 RepID=A0AA39IPT8_9BILA|nr:hypothetical protein QR680_010329 [Steinernema hermaphroditum]
MNSVPVAFVERCIHRLDSNSQAETTKLSGQFGKIGVLFEENTLNLELNIQVYAGSTEIDFWAEFYGCENREAFRSDNIDWRPSLIKYSNSLDINIRMGTAPEGTPPECFVQISKFLSHFPVVHFYDAAKEIDTSHLYSKLMRCGPFCAFDLTVGTYGIQQLDYLKTLLRNGSASITFPEGELSQRDVIQVARLFLESRDTEKLIFSNNTLTSRQKFVMQNTLGLCSLWKCIDVPDGANTKEIRLTQSPELARHIFRAGTGRSANVVDRHFDVRRYECSETRCIVCSVGKRETTIVFRSGL